MTQSNYVDITGLHTQALADIQTSLETQWKDIYGQDVNLDANSPDAQMLNIFAQSKADMLDTITQVYNSFNPNLAQGVVLDQRCALNGIIRKGATYTTTNVSVTADRTVTLQGLDTTPAAPFTVADSAGNKFYLAATVTIGSGTTSLLFRAATAGLIATTIGTITTIVTVTLGVTAVNNPSSAVTTGEDEETDVQLRARRIAAIASQSDGYLAGITGAIKGVSGVTDAVVYENVTNSTDVYGVPAHSMWAIVDNGANAAIADVIYRKRNAGCGMKGDVIVPVTQVNGTVFNVLFDRPVYENLYIALTVTSVDPAHTPDDVYLANKIFELATYGIYQVADFTAITTLVKELDPLAVVTAGGVSDTAGGYVPYKYPATIQSRWIASVSRIAITVV